MKDQPLDTHIHTDKVPEIEKWFRAAIKADASDLHLKVGMLAPDSKQIKEHHRRNFDRRTDRTTRL